jgi:hypothetical protein
MTKTRNVVKHRRRVEQVIDPYVVLPHTWTREELLRSRAEHGDVEVLETHRRTAA